jgi:formyl-CoA transferase
MISDRLARVEYEVVTELLEKAKIANSRLNSVADFLDHESLTARHRWRQVDIPGGRIEALVPPADLRGVPPVMGPVPAVGEHTDSILMELGRDASAITKLRSERVI